MSKIKPTYPKETKKHRVFYGTNSCTSMKAHGKKTNYICPNENCGYSSRVFISNFFDEFSCNESLHCPKHRVRLINVGNGSKIPKKGTKERKQLIEKYSK